MADVCNSLIAHLRSDTAVAALAGPRIDHDLDPGWALPGLAVELSDAMPVGQGLLDCLVAFHIRAGKRSEAAALAERLRALFQDQYHCFLAGSTADELLVVHSACAASGGIGKPADDGPWAVRDQYRFLIPN
jgi:hypothetical protein